MSMTGSAAEPPEPAMDLSCPMRGRVAETACGAGIAALAGGGWYAAAASNSSAFIQTHAVTEMVITENFPPIGLAAD
jgi:hypothetical protein